jgi:hypothetical protein
MKTELIICDMKYGDELIATLYNSHTIRECTEAKELRRGAAPSTRPCATRLDQTTRESTEGCYCRQRRERSVELGRREREDGPERNPGVITWAFL